MRQRRSVWKHSPDLENHKFQKWSFTGDTQTDKYIDRYIVTNYNFWMRKNIKVYKIYIDWQKSVESFRRNFNNTTSSFDGSAIKSTRWNHMKVYNKSLKWQNLNNLRVEKCRPIQCTHKLKHQTHLQQILFIKKRIFFFDESMI